MFLDRCVIRKFGQMNKTLKKTSDIRSTWFHITGLPNILLFFVGGARKPGRGNQNQNHNQNQNQKQANSHLMKKCHTSKTTKSTD